MTTAVDHGDVLIEQSLRFAETVIRGQPETPTPTCPDWSMRQLARHVGRANRWAAQIVATGADVTLDPRTVPDGRPPEGSVGIRDWLIASPQTLLDAVAEIGGPHVTVATFDGPHPARWWIRRLLHETTVHRADAAFAIHDDYELAPEIAADGIDEWLDRLAATPKRNRLPVSDGTLTLTTEDTEDRWTMWNVGGSLQMVRNGDRPPGGAEVSGPATALLLAVMRRLEAERAGCTIKGEAALWTMFLARTPYVAPTT